MNLRLSEKERPEERLVSLGEGTHYGVHDSLRNGIQTQRQHIIQTHPLQDKLKSYQEEKLDFEYDLMKQAYGLHMPFRLQMERAILSRPRGIPVRKIENFGLNTLNNSYMDIGFEDFLGDSNFSPVSVDVHAAMEKVLKL